MQAITDNGFERPSDVQSTAIPYCLERRDVRVQAKSGKGKTCVFVLSILNMIELQAGPVDVQCLVICNSHEMSGQIKSEFERFGKHLANFSVLNLPGKVPITNQIAELKLKKSAICVGTIGRVADLVRRGELDLTKLQFLVIDEVDQIITAEPNKAPLKDILDKKPDCQTMLFSATFPPEAKELSAKILREGFREVAVDDNQLILHGLVQHFMQVTESQKLERIIDLLKLKFTQAVVFVKNYERASTLTEFLTSMGIENKTFVGKMKSQDRDDLYKAFKRKEVRVIVCTDIFQRGVDFEGVNLVVHFDMPDKCDSYLHRSGRAGRFETNGLVVSFIANEDDQKVLQEIQDRFVIGIEKIETVDQINVQRAFLAK